MTPRFRKKFDYRFAGQLEKLYNEPSNQSEQEVKLVKNTRDNSESLFALENLVDKKLIVKVMILPLKRARWSIS